MTALLNVPYCMVIRSLDVAVVRAKKKRNFMQLPKLWSTLGKISILMKRLQNEYHLLQTSIDYSLKATINDVSLIVEFIKAIASYEGMADRVTATEN